MIILKKQRLEGIGKEIMRVISKILLEEVKNPKIKGLVSVTEVDVTRFEICRYIF